MKTPTPEEIAGEILIVEDSHTQALLLENILQRHGFTVVAARHGKLALELLAQCHPVLIISDIQMPEMDGFEFCRRVKDDALRRDIPVMLLTSLSSPQDIIHGLECGADNFVVKPYEEPFLMARIRTMLVNRALKQRTGDHHGIAVEFAGQRYVIDASRRQILNLLLSTYETAVKTNHDLIQAHEELKAAQAQLIEAEKLQSVGRLAAGVAHEVRNPLAIMEMGVAFFSDLPMSEDHQMILQEMREAVHRANIVITGLMDLSPRELGMHVADIHSVIERALNVLEAELAHGAVDIVREFGDGVPSLRVDEGKIEQVFMNVFTNALHAMPEGGCLIIRTGTKVLGPEEVAFDAGDRSGVRFREGERVIIVEVEDTGSGVASEHLNKLFEPFFSTKPTGKGVGLGLSVARKLVELHGGTIAVGNRAEGGARVTILFKIP
jgi:two-component system sensor histidine kinase/response regulator